MISSGHTDTPHPQLCLRKCKSTPLSPGICLHQLRRVLCGTGPSAPTQHTRSHLGQALAAEPSPRPSFRGGAGCSVPAQPPAASGLQPRSLVRGEGLGPEHAGGVSVGEESAGPRSLCGPGQLSPLASHPTTSVQGTVIPKLLQGFPGCSNPNMYSWALAAADTGSVQGEALGASGVDCFGDGTATTWPLGTFSWFATQFGSRICCCGSQT